VRPSKKNRKKLKHYLNHERVNIVWGDLRCYEDVLKSVTGMDIVLHVGGMVSPKADKFPEMTMEVNVLSTINIVKAIKMQPDADHIKVVYIGSVAQLGHKDIPNHFTSAGDLMTPALFDHYAVSKIMAERIIAESGLKYWVSLRQSGILYPELVKKGMNPIVFHVPLRGVLEWATVEDSGRLLVKLCEKELPDEFWRKFYNISSGKSFRLTNYKFMTQLLDLMYCPPPEKIFEPNWFATKNFHGCWYLDADVLEDYLCFRGSISQEDYFRNVMKKNVPWYFKLVKIVPSRLIKRIMRQIVHNKNVGTMHWIKSNDLKKIETYFGSHELWKQIPSWENFDKTEPSQEYSPENKRYIMSKPVQEWNLQDMQEIALWYGGKCLSNSMLKGDIDTLLLWENSTGCSFYTSPRYVVFGGFFPNAPLWEELEKSQSVLIH
jgi:nucleoside-diphosphate-sugar epimerase